MIIKRQKRKGDWTIVAVSPFEDYRLSLEARGLLGYLLIKPDAWEVNSNDLRKCGFIGNPPPEIVKLVEAEDDAGDQDKPAKKKPSRKPMLGEKTLRRIVLELESLGYMRRIFQNTKNGASWITEVYDTPLPKAERINHKGRTQSGSGSPSAKKDTWASPSCPTPSFPTPSFGLGSLASINVSKIHDDLKYMTPKTHFSANSAVAPSAAKKQGGSVKGKKGPEAKPLPSDFSITPAMEAWIEANTPLIPQQSAIEDFKDWANSTGAKSKDWEAAWRRFMRKRQEFAEQRADNRAGRNHAKDSHDAEKRANKQRDRESLAKLGYGTRTR